MRSLRFVRLAIALVVSSAVACGEESGAPDGGSGGADAGTDAGPIEIGDPLSWALEAPGPFRTGYATWEHTYRPPGQSADRTIRVHVWYPTLDASGAAARYGGLIVDRGSFVGATPASPAHASGAYPLHAFSHGHRGLAGAAHFLHRHLASHGWVTVAPDHTGNTLVDNVDPRPIALYYERSLDVREAIDALLAGEPGAPALGPIDGEHVLMSGHSFGTHTTWASAGAAFDADRIATDACSTETPCSDAELDVFRAGLRDPRIVAAVPMSGVPSSAFFGDAGLSAVALPILTFTGTADGTLSAQMQALFDRETGLDLRWADVEGACHEFTDLGCDDPAGEQERIVGRLVLAFARAHVLGDASATTAGVLDGTISVSDRVTLRVR